MKVGHNIVKLGKIDTERFTVVLVYEDGFKGVANLSQIFAQKRRKLISEILRGGMFARCFVNAGALAWPNGYELCPDALRMVIKTSNKQTVA